MTKNNNLNQHKVKQNHIYFSNNILRKGFLTNFRNNIYKRTTK